MNPSGSEVSMTFRPAFGFICCSNGGRRAMFSSLRRCVISVSAANLQSFVVRHNFDRPVSSIVHEIRRTVRQRILATQVVLNLRKGIRHILGLKRPKRASTGGVGNALEDFVVLVGV